MTGLRISDIRFTAGSPADRGRGLLGYVACTVGGQLRLDGITLRRTRDGRHTLSFPTRHDAQGRQHPLVRPVDAAARQAIEAAVFGALGLEGAPGREGAA